MTRTLGFATLLLTFLLTGPSAAQEALDDQKDTTFVPLEDALDRGDVPGEGWSQQTEATAGVQFAERRNTVGTSDGTSATYSLNLETKALYQRNFREWVNVLRYDGAITRVPNLPEMVKSTDDASAESLYFQFLRSHPWLGGFTRLAAEAPLFPGYDVRAEPVTYQIAAADDAVRTEEEDRLQLTDGFRPLTLKESLGSVVRPVTKPAFNLEVRAGLGARQTFTGGGLVISDNEETPDVVEVRTLRDTRQAGLEGALSATGELLDGKSEYRLYAEALVPYILSPEPESDASNVDLTTTEFGAVWKVHWVDWSAFVYTLSSKKEPLLYDKAQLSQTLMVTLSYSSAPAESAASDAGAGSGDS